MYAALSATNEAILRAHSRAELFDLVCEATARGAKFTSAAIALVDHHAELLRVAACYGPNADTVRNFKFSTSEQVPEGRGLTGTAFRTRQPCISNDVLSDDRIAPWAANARRNGIGSSAALPLFNGDRVEGVFLFNSPERGTFTPEFVELLQRLQANVAFALENFDRADEKAQADKQRNRLSGMFEALSATNEAIMRAKTREELFEVVCQAAVLGDVFASTTIGILDETRELVRVVAVKGAFRNEWLGAHVACLRGMPRGRGSSGFRCEPAGPRVINDYLNDARSAHWHSKATEDGTRAAASFPLLRAGAEADRHSAVPRARRACVHAGSGRAARPPGGKRLLCARQFRSRRGEGPYRGAEGAPDAHVRGAERHQRSDRARQVAHRAVRARVSGRVHRRQVHLDDHCARQGRQRPARDRRGRGAVGRDHAERSSLHRCRPARRPRHERHGVPHPAALCQQRLCQRQPCQRLPCRRCRATARAPARRSR